VIGLYSAGAFGIDLKAYIWPKRKHFRIFSPYESVLILPHTICHVLMIL